MSQAVPIAILFGILLLAYLGMYLGWKRRGVKHVLPELVALPNVKDLPTAKLDTTARYFGTTVAGDWLDRVVSRGLGARSSCRIRLTDEGIDVVRVAGSFRIPAAALRGARHDQGIAGKVVPPYGVLVVTWHHGDYDLDTGFRLTEATTETHNEWVRKISKLVKKENA